MRWRSCAVWLCAGLLVPGMALAQTEWTADPNNPVIPIGGPADWDYISYPGAVLLVDGTYHLFYMGQTEGAPVTSEYQIGHATSTDGLMWEKDPSNPVIVRGGAGEWDSENVGAPAVIYDGAEFRLWYNGNDGEVSGVGYATSPDGTTWTKYAGNPIVNPGPAGAFDDGSLWPGTVLFDGETYRMWYTGTRDVSGFIWAIGTAESVDGLSWTRNQEPVVEPHAPWNEWIVYAPAVVFDGSKYHMWYTGVDGAYGAGYALSDDGIEWTQYWDNPVQVLEGRDWPAVLRDEGSGVFRFWGFNNSFTGIDLFTSDCCSTAFASIIPAAAYAAGAEGSFYETDLDLSNVGSAAVGYRFSWLPRGASNKDPVQSELFTLGAGRSARYANVLAEVFDLEPDSFGALRIDATTDDLRAVVRIANTPQQPDAGSFGQSMTAIRPSDCTERHERRRLLFGSENDDMRFNVGCLNASEVAARVSFELFSADGALLGTESLILFPWSNNQLDRIFDPYKPATGYVDYWSDLANGRVWCYGSLLDNVTSDPTTISPK